MSDPYTDSSFLFVKREGQNIWVPVQSITPDADAVAGGALLGVIETAGLNYGFNPGGGYTGSTGWSMLRAVGDDTDSVILSSVGILLTSARMMAYNGATYDRIRTNLNQTILASAARVATVSSATFINYNGKGLKLFIDATAITATPSVTFAIEAIDPISGIATALLTSVAITAISHTVLTLYPGITVAANVSAADILPRSWRVTATHADADSITYSVGASVIQ